MSPAGAKAPLVLLTRPAHRSAPLARALEAAGAETLVWPVLTIRPTPAVYPAPLRAQAVLLTSARAAEMAPSPVDAPAFCVGGATARAARKAGFRDVRDADGDADALAKLVARTLSPGDGPLLYLRGRDISRDMAALLPGFEVAEVETYHAAPQPEPPDAVARALSAQAFTAAAFFSPRSATIFAEALTEEFRAGLATTTAVAMSARVSERMNQIGFQRVVVSQRPDNAAMCAAICGACGIAPRQDRVCD